MTLPFQLSTSDPGRLRLPSGIYIGALFEFIQRDNKRANPNHASPEFREWGGPIDSKFLYLLNTWLCMLESDERQMVFRLYNDAIVQRIFSAFGNYQSKHQPESIRSFYTPVPRDNGSGKRHTDSSVTEKRASSFHLNKSTFWSKTVGARNGALVAMLGLE